MAVPVEWLGNFQVNTGAAATGGQLDPRIIGLANGNILVAWTEAADGAAGGAAGTDIIGKIYDAEGNVVADAFRLNSNSTDDERNFDIAATSDGGFVMAYVDDSIAGPRQTAIVWERYDANGASTDLQVIASEFAALDFLANPTVAVDLTTNQSFITYTDDVGSDTDVSGRIVSGAGVLGAEFAAAQNSADFDGSADVTVLTNGNFVSVYEEANAGVNGGEFRIMNSGGAFLSSLRFTSSAIIDPKVASLAGGGFVVAFETPGNGGDVAFHIYNNSGVFVFSASAASGTDLQNEAEVVALADGGFVIVWDNDTDNTIEAARFTAAGVADGGVFTIDNLGGESPHVGLSADGRLLFTWIASNGSGEVFSSIWDPRGGTVNAGDYDPFGSRNLLNTNIITGGAGATVINSGDIDGVLLLGQAGNDTITGGNGAQTLRGGGGDDSVVGGSLANIGDDLIEGGDGLDTLIGVGGDDLIDGGDGDDSIDGGNGDDSLIGGSGADTVNGGGGTDTISIFDGEVIDNVDGGLGLFDRLDLSGIAGVGQGVVIDAAGAFTGFGGARTIAGIEIVFGTQLDDSIEIGGASSDTITGGGGNDTLSGLFGADDLDGGNGADVLLGGAGTDSLKGGAGIDQFLLGGFEQIDHVDGGGDFDTLDYSAMGVAGGAIALDLGAGTATGFGGTVTIANVEMVIGTDFNDTLDAGGQTTTILNGGLGKDRILGGADGQFLIGGAAGDTLEGGAGGDAFDGGAGRDWASYENASAKVRALLADQASNLGDALGDSYGSIENLLGSAFNDRLEGDSVANMLDGGAKNDKLDGHEGDDTLIGGIGEDTLFGSAGFDQFRLTTIGVGGPDRIRDFAPGEDVIALKGAIFGLAPGALDPDAFVLANSAQDAEDRLIYRADTGTLFFDADGTGAQAQVLIATLTGAPALVAGDFIVI